MSSAEPVIIRPVILCGGAGTRLWPLSREQCPKQFLHLFGDRSLLQQTIERLSGELFAPPIIVTGQGQQELLDRELARMNVAVEAVLLEPIGRNTAAAAALAAEWLSSTGRDELMLLVPSDHVIGDRDAFLKSIHVGIPHAAAGSIVTFGAEPANPNTQYGYIEAKADAGFGDGSYPIARFHEKPDARRAAHYLAVGGFSWNCGIFLAEASTIVEEMESHVPRTSLAVAASIARASVEGRFVWPDKEAFLSAENISFDHAIMEKTSRGVVVPVHMKWSDVGAWDAVWELGTKDADGNVMHGNVVSHLNRNCLLRADHQTRIAAIGLENIVVISVEGQVLVAPLDRVAELKDIVSKLRPN